MSRSSSLFIISNEHSSGVVTVFFPDTQRPLSTPFAGRRFPFHYGHGAFYEYSQRILFSSCMHDLHWVLRLGVCYRHVYRDLRLRVVLSLWVVCGLLFSC
jgi:hypothetical protein